MTPVAGPSPALSPLQPGAPVVCCAGDLDLDRLLDKLQQLLDCLVQEQLTPEQASHVMRISLGKFVQYLLKIRLNEPATERVNNWFYSVMHTTIELLRTQDVWEMVDCTSRILTDSPNYNFYQLGVCAGQLPSCDIDSQSSGSGSDYDDPKLSPKISHGSSWGTIISSISHDEVPPCLLRNVECFHQMGGFTAILERLDSTPRVGLSAMRALLRPFLKARQTHRVAAPDTLRCRPRVGRASRGAPPMLVPPRSLSLCVLCSATEAELLSTRHLATARR